MYYHTVVLHLFRPFLRVDLTNSKISPRDVCTSCANTISTLLSTYRNIYGLRRTTVLLTYIVLNKNIIDLLNLPDATAARNLELGIKSLREFSVNHAYAVRSLHIVLALSKQWNINLPVEVSQPTYDLPYEVNANEVPKSSVSGAWPPTPPVTSTYSEHQDQRRSSATEVPYFATSNSPRNFSQAPPHADLFWSPFPEHSVPLQAIQQSGPMDISAMIDVQNNGWDQLNRDGFKMVNINDPVLGVSNYIPDAQWSHG